MCWRVQYNIFAGHSRTIRNVFCAKAMRVIAVKRYRGREKVWKIKKVWLVFKKQHIAAFRLGSSMSAVCCWTVISNDSYGHLNNRLAHPPSLNSHYFFSRSVLLFPRTSALSEAHALTIREKRLLSRLAFHFFTVTEGLTIRYRQENRVTYDEIQSMTEIPIERYRSLRSRWKTTDGWRCIR